MGGHKTSFTKRQRRNKSTGVGLEKKQSGLMSRDSLIVFLCAIFKKFLPTALANASLAADPLGCVGNKRARTHSRVSGGTEHKNKSVT